MSYIDHDRLSSRTLRYETVEAAAAFFISRIEKGFLGDSGLVLASLKARLPRAQFAAFEKAAVDPMSTYGDPSIAEPVGWRAAFLAMIQGDTAIDNVSRLPTVPLNTISAVAADAGNFDWTGEGLRAPVTAMTTSSAPLPPFGIKGIRVVTAELARHANPSIQGVVQADMRRCLVTACDRAAFDPDRAAVADVSPASLTNGATEVTASGDVEADARDLLSAISGGNPFAPRFVMNRRVAITWAALRSATGQRVFPGLGANGGSIFGCEVLVGAGVPDVVVACDGDGILIASGGIDLSASRYTSLQMDDAPGAGGQAEVSLFQTGLIGIRGERWLNWSRRADAIAYRRTPIGGSPE